MTQSIEPANNLVLGLVKNYDFNTLKPFLYSLKNSVYTGDVCLIVSNVSEKTLLNLQEFSLHYPQFSFYTYWDFPSLKIPYKLQDKQLLYKSLNLYILLDIYPINRLHLWGINTFSKIVASYKRQNYYEVRANLTKHYLHLVNSRFFLYYLYILQSEKKYEKILLTDVRDVVFQDDPFNFVLTAPLNCFYEEDRRIYDCSYTSDWLKRSFGEKALSEIGHLRLSCAGTTIGTKEGIINYLEWMMDYILQSNYQRFGVDQAAHNLILHRNMIPDVKFYDNYQGPVLTMNYIDSEKLRFSQDGFLLNEDASVISVLHQYDRLADDLKNKLKAYNSSLT